MNPYKRGRKVYVIAHKCNNIKKVRKAIRQGANGIECDLRNDEGKWSISHDGISGEDIIYWLKEVTRMLQKKTNLISIIIFDIKKADSVITLLQMIHSYIPANISCVYSVPKISDAEVFPEAYKLLNRNEFFFH
jgi:hypothetical protein